MSLTEALRARDPEAFGLLYDEHGPRLYAYCHAVVGDAAGDALRDTFVAAARCATAPPSDDDALPVWLYTLARKQCARRPDRPRGPRPDATPLERAVARLRREHRDTLALTAALEIDEVADVLGVARDTADQMARMARRRLEQAVLAVLGGGTAPDDELVTALGRGRLHTLVAADAPEPPAGLRDRVLAACTAALRTPAPLLFDEDGLPIQVEALFGPAEAATRPMVAAAPAPAGRHGHQPPRGQRSWRRPTVATALLAACVAATIAGVTMWPSATVSDRTSSVDGSTMLTHQGSSAGAPGPSTAGSTPLDRTSPPGRAPSATEPPGKDTPSGRHTDGRPAPTATTATTARPKPTGSPMPLPTPKTPAPTFSTPGGLVRHPVGPALPTR